VDRCALFVDASYVLADGAMAVHGTRRRDSVSWDYAGLIKLLSGLATERTTLPVLRCYWYEATVEGRRTPEHDALADLAGVKLRLGRLRPGRREGVENGIHRDLMALARSGAISDAIVVSGDEDLTEVIAEVQELGIRVLIVHITVDGNWTISRPLRQECDDVLEISSAHLQPFVELTPGAEPSRRDDEYPSDGYPARSLSNGHGPVGAVSHHGLPAAALPAPPSIYTAPVPAEYQRPALPPADRARQQEDSGAHAGPAGSGSRSPSAGLPGQSNGLPQRSAGLPDQPGQGQAGQGQQSQPAQQGQNQGLPSPGLPAQGQHSQSLGQNQRGHNQQGQNQQGQNQQGQGQPGQGQHSQSAGLPRGDSGQGMLGTGTGPLGSPLGSPAPPAHGGQPAHSSQPAHGGQPSQRGDDQVSRMPGNPSYPPLDPFRDRMPPAGDGGLGQGLLSQGQPGQGQSGQAGLSQPAHGPLDQGQHSQGSSSQRHGMGGAGQMGSAGQQQYPPASSLYGGPNDSLPPFPGQAAPQHSAPGQHSGPGLGQPFGMPQSGPYSGPQPAVPQPPPVAVSLADAVQAAHAEGFGFGEAVARDAPALWLEAVLARKPRMPSDLEARLLQGSALPIDSLLHDEVRHALRRGFWDALERSRR
jgi:NYN domain